MSVTIPFFASLVDVNGNTSITSNSDCTALIITDSSNYTTNNDVGTAPFFFQNFRRIIIDYYLGTTINMSSLGDGDVLIPPANSGLNTFTQAITTGDGRYQITLRTVPTWAPSRAYADIGVCVYFNPDGKFYISIQPPGSNMPPDVNPTLWQEILEVNLPVQYNTTLFVYTDCEIQQCLADKTECAFCLMGDAFCDDNMLCSNKCFLDAAKLLMLYYSIQIDVQNQNADAVDMKSDMIKKICQC